MTTGIKPVPASFFGIILGLAGLGGDWRAAARIWSLPAWIGELIMFVAASVWLVLLLAYIAKWWARPAEAIGELQHPIQCCFVGLIPVSTVFVGIAVLPYWRPLGVALCVLGAVGALGFAVWRQGKLWRGGRDMLTTTPILYLPGVAGNFAVAIAAGTLGLHDWGQLFFGAGFFTWLAVESVVLQRLLNAPPLAPPLRPSLGIQLAPPVVALVAYLSVSDGEPDWFARALLGYGLFQALVLARLSRWILEQPFTAAYWAITFGMTSMAFGAERMVERGARGLLPLLAPVLFVAANVVVLAVSAASVTLLMRGRLLPLDPINPSENRLPQ